MGLRWPVLLNNVHGSTLERDNDPTVLMAVHVQRRVWHHQRPPDVNAFIFELGKTLRLLRRLLRTHHNDASGESNE
jgi:hypothetical protein